MGKDRDGKELGLGIAQRKDGRYCGRYFDRFGNRKSVYADNLRELRSKLNMAIYEDDNYKSIRGNLTMDKLYNLWLDEYKRDFVRPSTIIIYRDTYERQIQPFLGNVKISDLRQIDIKRFLRKIKDKGYSFETVNKTRILICDMLDKAVVNDFLIKNPAKGIRLRRDEELELRWLTVEEQQDFFDVCKGTFYDNFFTVAINTGMRIGELAGLKEEDIDFDTNMIHVRRTLLYAKLEGDSKKTFHFGDPKTKKSVRDIPINARCMIALKKQIIQKQVVESKAPKSKMPSDEMKDLLFTTRYNTALNPSIVCEAIQRIVDEVNLTKPSLEEMETFSCHCFRRTFATRCFEADIPPKTVQAYLGHTSLQMTMDLYTKVMPEKLQSDMTLFDEMLDRLNKDEEDSSVSNDITEMGVGLPSDTSKIDENLRKKLA